MQNAKNSLPKSLLQQAVPSTFAGPKRNPGGDPVTVDLRFRWHFLNELKICLGYVCATRRGCDAILLTRQRAPSACKRILVATSFSRSSFAAARTALRLSVRAQITFLHAFLLPEGPVHDLSRRQIAREAELTRMRKFVAQLEEGNTLVSSAVHYGSPDAVTSAYANRFGADLIVLGRKRSSALTGLLPGEMERYLLKHTASDLLIVFDAP